MKVAEDDGNVGTQGKKQDDGVRASSGAEDSEEQEDDDNNGDDEDEDEEQPDDDDEEEDQLDDEEEEDDDDGEGIEEDEGESEEDDGQVPPMRSEQIARQSPHATLQVTAGGIRSLLTLLRGATSNAQLVQLARTASRNHMGSSMSTRNDVASTISDAPRAPGSPEPAVPTPSILRSGGPPSSRSSSDGSRESHTASRLGSHPNSHLGSQKSVSAHPSHQTSATHSRPSPPTTPPLRATVASLLKTRVPVGSASQMRDSARKWAHPGVTTAWDALPQASSSDSADFSQRSRRRTDGIAEHLLSSMRSEMSHVSASDFPKMLRQPGSAHSWVVDGGAAPTERRLRRDSSQQPEDPPAALTQANDGVCQCSLRCPCHWGGGIVGGQLLSLCAVVSAVPVPLALPSDATPVQVLPAAQALPAEQVWQKPAPAARPPTPPRPPPQPPLTASRLRGGSPSRPISQPRGPLTARNSSPGTSSGPGNSILDGPTTRGSSRGMTPPRATPKPRMSAPGQVQSPSKSSLPRVGKGTSLSSGASQGMLPSQPQPPKVKVEDMVVPPMPQLDESRTSTASSGMIRYSGPTLMLRDHTLQVWAVAFSPDSAQLASTSQDRTVCVWDAVNGHMLANLQGHSRCVSCVAWSADASLLATGSHDTTVRIWNVAAMEDGSNSGEGRALEGHTHNINTVAWGGHLLASGSLDSSIVLWDAMRQARAGELKGHFRGVRGVAFSPDGQLLASASWDRSFRLWDLRSAQQVAVQSAIGDAAGVCFVGAEGRLQGWEAAPDGSVKLWDLTSRQHLGTLAGHTQRVTCCAWAADGKQLATGSWDKTVRLWDAETLGQAMILQGNTDNVLTVSISPMGDSIAGGGSDKVVRVWHPFGRTLKDALDTGRRVRF